MSGLKVPLFFGSILTLVVIVLQNRTPAFQLVLLGVKSRPLPLGLLVSVAALSGLFLGAILLRTGQRPRPNQKPKSSSDKGSGLPDFQPFRTTPEASPSETSGTDAFDGTESDDRDLGEQTPQSARSVSTKGWDTGVSSSWTAKDNDSDNSFWSRPVSAKSGKKRTGRDAVIPIKPDQSASKSPKLSRSGNDGESDPGVVEAEYRVVTPYQREETDEFDDEFFDDFFDEEKS